MSEGVVEIPVHKNWRTTSEALEVLQVKDRKSLAEAYRAVIRLVVEGRVDKNAAGAINNALKQLEKLLPPEPSEAQQEAETSFRQFLDEHPDIQGTYVAWLKGKRGE